jgi:alkylhydroperoxidase family enzyme
MSGLSGQEIEAARKGESTDPKSQAMLSLAQSIIATQGNVPDDALVAARTANLSEAEIVETVVVVAMNILTNFFNHVADTEIDFPQVII